MDFEKKSIELAGTLTNDKEISPKDKELVSGYMGKGFKRIQELEEKMISQMARNASLFHSISRFFPTISGATRKLLSSKKPPSATMACR